MSNKSIFPVVLLSIYVVEFIVCAINPFDRAVWWAENIPIMLIVASLVIMYLRNIRFSNFGYACMAFLILWHTIGGHYTFERVPFDWFNNVFGFERNMFDRIGHFSVGLYAYPVAEYLYKTGKTTSVIVALLFGVFAVGTVAAVYEIIEWIYAATAGGTAGASFLGSQGDIWDAQKDMLFDILGALSISLCSFSFLRKEKVVDNL
jgi:putative membrane protein